MEVNILMHGGEFVDLHNSVTTIYYTKDPQFYPIEKTMVELLSDICIVGDIKQTIMLKDNIRYCRLIPHVIMPKSEIDALKECQKELNIAEQILTDYNIPKFHIDEEKINIRQRLQMLINKYESHKKTFENTLIKINDELLSVIKSAKLSS